MSKVNASKTLSVASHMYLHSRTSWVGRLGAKAKGYAARATAFRQDLQQTLAADRGETVPATGDHLTAKVDVDVVPLGELSLHLAVDLRVGMFDPTQGLVG